MSRPLTIFELLPRLLGPSPQQEHIEAARHLLATRQSTFALPPDDQGNVQLIDATPLWGMIERILEHISGDGRYALLDEMEEELAALMAMAAPAESISQTAITRWYISQHHPLWKAPERAESLQRTEGDALEALMDDLRAQRATGTIGDVLPQECLEWVHARCRLSAQPGWLEFLTWEADSAVGFSCQVRVAYAQAHPETNSWESVARDVMSYAY